MPLLVGTALKKRLSASTPPAEAPMAANGQELRCLVCWFKKAFAVDVSRQPLPVRLNRRVSMMISAKSRNDGPKSIGGPRIDASPNQVKVLSSCPRMLGIWRGFVPESLVSPAGGSAGP